MSLFSKKAPQREERMLVIDIGSGSVGAAMIEMKKDETLGKMTPRIFYSSRIDIFAKGNKNFDSYVEAMLSALKNAIKQIVNERGIIPDKIHVILAAPWYASQTRIIEFSKNNPFTFTKKLWYELLLKEAKLFENEVTKKFAQFEEKPKVIEKRNMEVRLNGYHTDHPIGKRASEARMPVYMSVAPEHLLKSIEKTIAQFFTRDVIWSTYLFASYVVARDLFIGEKTYFLVDIGGEVTDIGIVKDEILSEAFSFPSGRNHILGAICKHMAVSFEESVSLLRLYGENMLHGRKRDNIGVAINYALAEWTKEFEKAVAHLAHDFTTPKTIFVTVDKDVRALYEDAMHKESFTQFTRGTHFNVIIIDASALHEYCALENLDEKDHFLMIDAMYSARQYFNKEKAIA